MRDQVRIGSGLCWALAWLMALGGALAYLLWPGDGSWLAGVVLVAPVLVLAAWRHDRRGGSADVYAGPDGGPWGPP